MIGLPRYAISFLLMAASLIGAAQAETGTVRIARQWGLAWMPFVLMERNKLVEKHAAAAGLQVGTEWRTFAGGSPMNDALLSGSLDYATTGIPGFLTLWDKARTALPVKAVSAFGSIPFALITRNPDVKTLGDFSSKDKIALPSVKISGQAVLLQMAAEKFFGPGGHTKLDPLTVTRSNPDGLAALLQPNGEVDSQFSSPPYLQIALKSAAIHIVMTTRDVFETPFSNGLLYTTQKFHDSNPRVYAIVLDALKEAIAAINADKQTAVAQYLEVTKEKVTLEQMMEALADPLVDFSLTPHNVYPIAVFMQRTGAIRGKPEGWKDLFFPEVHDLPGS